MEAAGNLSNNLFDKWQNNLQNNLENFGSDDVKGLWALIPKNIRQAASGITKAIAAPITSIGDGIQASINGLFKKKQPAPVVNAQVSELAQIKAQLEAETEVSAEVKEYLMMLAELRDMREQAALDALKATIRAEVMQAMTSEEMVGAVPVENRGLFKVLANLTQPLINAIYDKAQSRFIDNLRNFGTDKVTGLMALIPKGIRQWTAGIAGALANPLDKLADGIQGKLNNMTNSLLMGNLAKSLQKQA